MARLETPLSGSVFSAVSFETEVSSAEPSPDYSHAKLKLEESKTVFVEALVDSAVLIIEAIWPRSIGNNHGSQRNMPLRKFIQETLKRSRTSYSTFQACLYYLILIKSVVYDMQYSPTCQYENIKNWSKHKVKDTNSNLLSCGRRTFLTSLILASKYLQDRNYSACAWSKISGLSIKELNNNEVCFLKAVDWNLHISSEIYSRWSSLLLMSASDSPLNWMQKIVNIGSDVLDPSVTSKVGTNMSESLCPWEFIELSPEPQLPPYYLSPSPSPVNAIGRACGSIDSDSFTVCPAATKLSKDRLTYGSTHIIDNIANTAQTTSGTLDQSRKRKLGLNDVNENDDIIILTEKRSIVDVESGDDLVTTVSDTCNSLLDPGVCVVDLINSCRAESEAYSEENESKFRPHKRSKTSEDSIDFSHFIKSTEVVVIDD